MKAKILLTSLGLTLSMLMSAAETMASEPASWGLRFSVTFVFPE